MDLIIKPIPPNSKIRGFRNESYIKEPNMQIKFTTFVHFNLLKTKGRRLVNIPRLKYAQILTTPTTNYQSREIIPIEQVSKRCKFLRFLQIQFLGKEKLRTTSQLVSSQRKLIGLHLLNIQSVEITGIEQLFKRVRQYTNMSKLSLQIHNGKISEKSFENVVSEIAALSYKLTFLSINESMIGSKSIYSQSYIFSQLGRLDSLKHAAHRLYVKNKQTLAAFHHPIYQYNPQNLEQLQLYLDTQNLTIDTFNMLTNLKRYKDTLKQFSFELVSCYKVSLEGYNIFMDVLQEFTALNSIELKLVNHTDIPKYIATSFQALSKMPSKILHLWLQLSSSGGSLESLARFEDVLQSHPYLETLHLSLNGKIKDEELIPAIKSLAHLKNLKQIAQMINGTYYLTGHILESYAQIFSMPEFKQLEGIKILLGDFRKKVFAGMTKTFLNSLDNMSQLGVLNLIFGLSDSIDKENLAKLRYLVEKGLPKLRQFGIMSGLVGKIDRKDAEYFQQLGKDYNFTKGLLNLRKLNDHIEEKEEGS